MQGLGLNKLINKNQFYISKKMKKTVGLSTILILILINACKSEKPSNTAIETQIVYDSSYFGNYYKIGKYDIYAPFKEQPTVKIIADNDMFFAFEHRYADIHDTNEIVIYGISIYRLKKEPKWDPSMHKEDIIAKIINNGLEISGNNTKLISYDTINFHDMYTIRQHMDMVISHDGIKKEFNLFDYTFLMDNLIIRPYVLTTPTARSKSIAEGFFNSLKFK